jgi:uncharacterized membrane protein
MESTHNKARLEQFSDGVIAIAITLLALKLPVPAIKNETLQESFHEIIPLIPALLTFILSFITIAIFWVNHHQLTHTIGRISRRVLWSNNLFLLFLTLIPFVTEIASSNILHPLSMFTYSLVFFGGSVSFSILRYFVHRSCNEHRIPVRRSLVGPVCYFLAMVSLFFSVWICYFFLAVPALFYFLPKDSPIKEALE